MAELRFVRGDIFASACRTLVNPVNCVGTCGKGLAKEFKRRFPLSVKAYEKDIRDATGRSAFADLWVGTPTEYEVIEAGKIVVFFATKIHWRDTSDISYIDEGLVDLAGQVADLPDRYQSVALPALGCGCGGLRWSDVRPLLERSGREMVAAGVDVEVYEPYQ